MTGRPAEVYATRHALTRLRERFPEFAQATDHALAHMIRAEVRDARAAHRVVVVPCRGRFLCALTSDRAYVVRDGAVVTTLRGPLQ